MAEKKRTPTFGQLVKCAAFIKPSGNFYAVNNGTEVEDFLGIPQCAYWEHGASEGVTVEDFHECNRFKIIRKEFSGIFVGTTVRNTRVSVELNDHPYSGSHFITETTRPEKFAVVYFANNKKRLVPLTEIEVLEMGACKDG